MICGDNDRIFFILNVDVLGEPVQQSAQSLTEKIVFLSGLVDVVVELQ